VAGWEQRFQKTRLLAEMILSGSENVEQKETYAGQLAQDLAAAGFVDQAMEVAALLKEPRLKGHVYTSVLNSAEKASTDQLVSITQFYIDAGMDVASHPLMTKLDDRSGDFSRKLGPSNLQAVLGVMLEKYQGDKDFSDRIARILVFDDTFRVPFSEWMWEKDKDFLYQVLQSDYFIDPDYAPKVLKEASGAPHKLTMEKDMPWVYTYKQKYYVDYLVNLTAKTGMDIPPPASLDFAGIKTWLDANTETIAASLQKLYPQDPARSTRGM
jgi:hypothetical protein